MTAKNMGLVWIVVSDIKKAIEFYTKTVGLKLTEFNEEYGWAELSAPGGGTLLGLAVQNEYDNMKPGSNAVVTLTVDNLQKSIQEFQKKNVKLVGDVMEVPNIVKLQTFVDSDGNHFQLVESLGGH